MLQCAVQICPSGSLCWLPQEPGVLAGVGSVSCWPTGESLPGHRLQPKEADFPRVMLLPWGQPTFSDWSMWGCKNPSGGRG